MSRFVFLDPNAWHYEDKAWLAKRKAEWKYIQKNLKICSSTMFYKGPSLSAHKNFFFKGEYEKNNLGIKAGAGYITPLIMIWYYPEISASLANKYASELESF